MTMTKEWTAEKFEPASEYEDMDDSVTYCVYCYDEVPDWKGSCCGENHFLTGFQIKEHERDLNEVDRQMKFMHEEVRHD
jgi:hypothetical protein